MATEMSYEEFERRVHEPVLTPAGNCPVMSLLDVLQGKWKFKILYELCIAERLRFGQLRKYLDGITSTMLTSSLRELEEAGLVTREQFPEIPPRVEYALTEKGRALLPVFYEMARWGLTYVE